MNTTIVLDTDRDTLAQRLRRQVEKAREGVRPLLQLLLRDHLWHPMSLMIEQLTPYLSEDEGEAQVALEVIEGKRAPGRVGCQSLQGRVAIVRSVVEQGVQEGFCKVTRPGPKQRIKLLRPDARLERKMERLRAVELTVRQEAEQWLQNDRRVAACEVRGRLEERIGRSIDRRARTFIACSVAEWFEGQIRDRAPDKGWENGAWQEPGPPTSLAANTRPPEQTDPLFWEHAGFFDPTRLWYFSPEANEPTRWTAKAIVVQTLAGRKALPLPPGSGEEDTLAAWSPDDISLLLGPTMERSVLLHLHNWALRNGPPEVNNSNRERCVEAQIDWKWVARRLREEVEKHGHRAGKRALELACGAPYEQVEWKLGGFVGTLGEMFLRFTQAR